MTPDDPAQPDDDGKLPDAKQWLSEHGFAAVSAQIAEIEAEWARAGKKTRRNWWDVLAGGADGKPRTVAGRTFPVLEHARRRKGLAGTATAQGTPAPATQASDTVPPAPPGTETDTGASSSASCPAEPPLGADRGAPARRSAFAHLARALSSVLRGLQARARRCLLRGPAP